jgi:RNA polymerase sigma factor (sigma-70 family)
VALLQEAACLADAQQLGSFLADRDEAAFEALVRRHGPMVWGICRRVLGDRHDAEDAFQATFLVLIRKAAGIGKRELLANWLYGVAYRTALGARKTAARRKARERQASNLAHNPVTREDGIRELLPVLDEELSRLPDKYRVPIVLCDLQGKTRRAAARELDLSEAALSTRLARARVMLAKRLSRHGTAIATIAGLPVLAAAAVPNSLVASTLKAGMAHGAGETIAAAATIQAASLSEGVIKAMFFSRVKGTASIVIALGVIAIGGGLCIQQAVTALAGVPTPAAARKESAQPAADQEPAAPKRIKIGNNVYVESEGKKVVRVLVRAQVCLREGLLEQLLTRKRTKEHEAILSADIDAKDIHTALLLAGAEPGKPVQFQPQVLPPTGTIVRITLEYADKGGKTVRVPAQQWVRHLKSKKDLTHDWVFAGSILAADADNPAILHYGANQGDVICVANFESALLDLPILSSNTNTDLDFEAHTERIPRLGTAVLVLLEPAAAKKK